ncbi:MAG: SufD family Fe-S cluster assembly protein [bacterium]
MQKIVRKYDRPEKWEVKIPFDKVGEEKEWVGIIDARREGEYELLVVTDHMVKGTKGRITVRVVVGKESKVRIKGKIEIEKGAQETDTFLEFRVLTLDKSARVRIEPELEIEADNVIASHAASVGPVDSEQILYLRSKGLGEIQAKKIIVEGFLMIQ